MRKMTFSQSTDMIVFWSLICSAPFIGSFLATLVLRLPEGRDVIFLRSQCDSCEAQLRVIDLIPIISWLFFTGKCRQCRSPIGKLYPLVEIGALIPPLWASTEVSGWLLLSTSVMGWILMALALIDWRSFTLPPVLVLLLAILGLIVVILNTPDQFVTHAIAGVSGLLIFVAVNTAYRIVRGRDGLGRGDAYLLGASGVWVSIVGLGSVVLISSLAGLVTTLVLSRGRATFDRPVPFGTFLTIGLWLTWLYGPLIVI